MLLCKSGTDYQFYPPLVKAVDVGIWSGIYDLFKYNDNDWNFATNPIPSGKDIWILVNDEFIRTKSGTLPAGRCYLELDSRDSAPSIMHIRSYETGIGTTVNLGVDLNSGWYTLEGRKLERIPTQKGIYISNGKKVVIR